jgi:hypothetical protein
MSAVASKHGDIWWTLVYAAVVLAAHGCTEDAPLDDAASTSSARGDATDSSGTTSEPGTASTTTLPMAGTAAAPPPALAMTPSPALPGDVQCSHRSDIARGAEWSDRTSSLVASAGLEDLGGLLRIDAQDNLVFAFGGPGIESNSNPGDAVAFREVVVGKLNARCELLWSRRFEQPAGPGGLWPLGLATDSASNIVLTGTLYGSIDFGNGPLNGSRAALFAVQLDPSGASVWSQQFGPRFGPDASTHTYPSWTASVSIGPSDEIIVYGSARSQDPVGSDALLAAPNTCANSPEGTTCDYVMQLATSGDRSWARRFQELAFTNRIAIDRQGALLVSATNVWQWSDGSRQQGAHLLAKLDSDTSLLWGRTLVPTTGPIRYAGFDWNWDRRLAIDADDAILYLGQGPDGLELRTLRFDSAPRLWWLTKLSTSGEHEWDSAIAHYRSATPAAITVDPERNPLIAGHFAGSVDLGAGPIAAAGRRDGFVLKLDAAGSPLWSRPVGDDQEDYLSDIASDSDGNIWVIGWSGETMPLGPNSSGEAMTRADRSSAFITKLSR